ncbi:hypothetical protein B296_00045106 [Ensete ventricosum]|uniref:Uncharacterized protein n=1 Tax=Ensete ventricosum TaxID=4639 RepID=A0A426YUC7_ENSVE|nr:hypothetical protein B296_00045106 [Ensete ventricosum]
MQGRQWLLRLERSVAAVAIEARLLQREEETEEADAVAEEGLAVVKGLDAVGTAMLAMRYGGSVGPTVGNGGKDDREVVDGETVDGGRIDRLATLRRWFEAVVVATTTTAGSSGRGGRDVDVWVVEAISAWG